jgi:predicted RNase H-like HicB family nuclease
MKYRVYLEPDEDGVFVATCPALPGCVSQGRTRAEATENIREAIEGYLKSLRKHGDPVPPSILEEVIDPRLSVACPRLSLSPTFLSTSARVATAHRDGVPYVHAEDRDGWDPSPTSEPDRRAVCGKS